MNILPNQRIETPQEKAERFGVPIIPKIPDLPKQNNVIAVCGECGLALNKIMSYVCTKSRCPTGLAGFTSCIDTTA